MKTKSLKHLWKTSILLKGIDSYWTTNRISRVLVAYSRLFNKWTTRIWNWGGGTSSLMRMRKVLRMWKGICQTLSWVMSTSRCKWLRTIATPLKLFNIRCERMRSIANDRNSSQPLLPGCERQNENENRKTSYDYDPRSTVRCESQFLETTTRGVCVVTYKN